jgi:hypothetical protein
MIRRLLFATMLPLVVTGVTLAGVAWNRSGGREPTVLTERELPLRSTSEENTKRVLSIAHQATWWGGEGWLTPAKLSSLGFDTTVDPVSPDAEAHYRRMLRREVYVALELGGPAWDAWAREYEVNTRQWSPEGPTNARPADWSRLVPVDAELDASVLERRYPDGRTHVITRGVVRVLLYTPQGARPRVSGVVESLTPRTLYVPAHIAEGVGSKPYRVTVRYGRRYEPWIVGVER